MNAYMPAATLVSIVNVVLLLALIYLYSLILMKTRASYAAGLLIFAFLLLLQNVVTVYGYAAMSGFIGSGFEPVLLGVSICECGGLLALLRVTI